MAVANLTWVVADGGGESQEVYYKKMGIEEWTFFGTVGPEVDAVTITGLVPNRVYQCRLKNNCAEDMSAFSDVAEGAYLTCPDFINTNVDGMTLVGFFFPHVGGDVDSYFVELLSMEDVVLQSKTVAPSGGPMVVSFWGGLTPGTDYQMRVSPKATGEFGVYSGTCAPVGFITSPCPMPTDVVAEATLSCLAPTDVVAEAYVLAD